MKYLLTGVITENYARPFLQALIAKRTTAIVSEFAAS
jgi:hypothetical protein